ncbi:hypothetical protein ES703_110107 [subsurface metagenome]
MDHAFSARELEPGQSYSDTHPRGWPWVGGIQPGIGNFLRVEAAIEVYTPEGWVEADRAVGEPFSWQYTFPLPELTIIEAPEYAPAYSLVDIECAYYNPGFCSPPSGGFIANGVRFPSGEGTGYSFPPDQTTPFTHHTYIRNQDMTIEITPFRVNPFAGGADILGEPVSVTIRVATVPMYHLDISINGEGIVLPEDVSGNYLEGTVIELTAYPAPGWWFHSWEGTDNNSANPTTVTMDSDKQVVCNFTQVAPAGCLPVVAGGILLVVGIIAGIIALIIPLV